MGWKSGKVRFMHTRCLCFCLTGLTLQYLDYDWHYSLCILKCLFFVLTEFGFALLINVAFQTGLLMGGGGAEEM